ncbi:hypothetical protein BB559_000425, partial [Furculomyces boomerangus]
MLFRFLPHRHSLNLHLKNSLRSISYSKALNQFEGPKYYFDSHLIKTRLEECGFDNKQAEATVSVLQQVIRESTEAMLKNVISKSEQEKKMSAYKIDLSQLKSEIQMIEKTDLSIMKAENERLHGEVSKLKQRLREEISKSQASVRLDMSLEKGRIRDEQASQEMKIKKADAKIENEIVGLKTQMESIKLQILQYMFGTITGTGALILAYIRMFNKTCIIIYLPKHTKINSTFLSDFLNNCGGATDLGSLATGIPQN